MVDGRPYWGGDCAAGRPRVAPLVRQAARGGGWGAERPASVGLSAPEHVRQLAAAHWFERAQAEHASVASFARHVLELLGVGAPRHLVEGASRAALDEIEHARLALALAAGLNATSPSGAGTSLVGPAALDVSDSRLATQPSLLDVAVAAARDGCVGETVAAVEARASALAAVDPSVREVLLTISADEARHAALGWSMVQWALAEMAEEADGEGGARMRPKEAVHAAFEAAVERLSATARGATPAGGGDDEEGDDDRALAALGALSAAARSRVRADAISMVINPARKALLAGQHTDLAELVTASIARATSGPV